MDINHNDVKGSAEILGGSYIAYEGINHGLPRALGIRIEYHTTSKENAKKIKSEGGFLDPKYGGGDTGWSKRVNSDSFLKNSKNYVHITGVHKDAPLPSSVPNAFRGAFRAGMRQLQCFMYKGVGNTESEELKKVKSFGPRYIFTMLKGNLTPFSNTERFCISGVDSYFNNEFIPDTDDPAAIKTTKKVKVHSNRMSAMVDGLKNYGLKGIKENKTRTAVGIGALTGGLYFGKKLLSCGITNVKRGNMQEF